MIGTRSRTLGSECLRNRCFLRWWWGTWDFHRHYSYSRKTKRETEYGRWGQELPWFYVTTPTVPFVREVKGRSCWSGTLHCFGSVRGQWWWTDVTTIRGRFRLANEWENLLNLRRSNEVRTFRGSPTCYVSRVQGSSRVGVPRNKREVDPSTVDHHR